MRGGCEPLQYSRMSKHIRQIVFFAKPCPFVRHKFHRTNSVKKKIQVLLSGGEAPQQFTRASKHERYISYFAKPCLFVRHKFYRTNSGKKKIQVLLPRFSPKEKRARSRARSSRRPPQRAKDLIRSKSAGKSEFFSRKAAKKEGKPSPGVFP